MLGIPDRAREKQESGGNNGQDASHGPYIAQKEYSSPLEGEDAKSGAWRNAVKPSAWILLGEGYVPRPPHPVRLSTSLARSERRTALSLKERGVRAPAFPADRA